MSQPSSEGQVRFLADLQRLLSEGQFVATYKYALLMALADLAVEHGDDSGDALPVSTKLIAEKFIAYYWRQTMPYMSSAETANKGGILRQNTGQQAAVIRQLEQARAKHGHSLLKLQSQTRQWRSLVSAVERVVVVMPLWKLQTVGSERLDFLYASSSTAGQIDLKPGVAYCLRKFYPLVADLVRGAWVRYVRRVNTELLGSAADLNEFLFGSERAVLTDLQPVLADLQHGRCFYCEKALQRGAEHVDHFIPWSRYPVDLGHNFVLAHGSCNCAKGDRLAAVDHLQAWTERNHQFGQQLTTAFGAKDFICNIRISNQIAEWSYAQTETVSGLTWLRGDQLVPLDVRWRTLLMGGVDMKVVTIGAVENN